MKLLRFLMLFSLISCSNFQKPSTKSIVYLPEMGCTGWIYKENRVVTAAHCIPNTEEKHKVVFDGLVKWSIFEVIKIDEKLDIAILKGSTLEYPAVKGLECSVPERYSKAITIGYPVRFSIPIKAEYEVQGINYFAEISIAYLIFTGKVEGGCSGSPIFNEDYRVISMTQIKYFGYPGGIETSKLCEFLKEYK